MNHLGLFAKYWQPGAVKTRLAATLGDDIACELYRSFLFHLLENLHTAGDSREVVFSPCERRQEFRSAIDPSWQLAPQVPGDLGQRMQVYLESKFMTAAMPPPTAAVPKVVLIGADSPQLDAAEIETAFDALDGHDAVIGPSTDGGYYLIGMRQRCLPVFSGIRWSTQHVVQETMQRLESNQATFHLLPARTDVDDWESLQTLIRDLTEPATPESDCMNTGLQLKIEAVLSNRDLP